ncbi:30S ribosomal protein S9 [Cavenderia fasciculata]|uniref:30S ribosomal protein S9 n=1 Tax=Cavenderia fasciculata TaxID=261658 RepID=F4PGU4_CACFS|nr:30S ribosomal protein S9 [Cavenderia fasciculata]EGG24928.1 30S ribosomal protein S9 [Cavenderia fasciculata]|eukprot:XP_004362779.1 30S ribosomal protein S9 [Cavenderia fasciculata]
MTYNEEESDIYELAEELDKMFDDLYKKAFIEAQAEAQLQAELIKDMCSICGHKPVPYKRPPQPPAEEGAAAHPPVDEMTPVPLLLCEGSCLRAFHLHCLGLPVDTKPPWMCEDCHQGRPVLHFDSQRQEYFYYYYEGVLGGDDDSETSTSGYEGNDEIVSDLGTLSKEEKKDLRQEEETHRVRDMYFDPVWCMWRCKSRVVMKQREERQRPILSQATKSKRVLKQNKKGPRKSRADCRASTIVYSSLVVVKMLSLLGATQGGSSCNKVKLLGAALQQLQLYNGRSFSSVVSSSSYTTNNTTTCTSYSYNNNNNQQNRISSQQNNRTYSTKSTGGSKKTNNIKKKEEEFDYESFTNNPYDNIVDTDLEEFEEESEITRNMPKREFDKGFSFNRTLPEKQSDRAQDNLDAMSSHYDVRLRSQYDKLFSQQLNKRNNTAHIDQLDKFDIRSPIAPPSADDTVHHPEMSADWAQRDFDEFEDEEEVEVDEEDELNNMDADTFTPFIPARPKVRTENTYNGIAHGYSKRKDAKATAYIKLGSGELLINGRTLTEYFGNCITYKDAVIRPLVISETLMKWDINIKVIGGGIKGQSEAICRALALAISNYDLGYRMALRFAGLLKNDIRRVERKKPGQLKARKKFPLVKR